MHYPGKAPVLLALVGSAAIAAWLWSKDQAGPAQSPPRADTVAPQGQVANAWSNRVEIPNDGNDVESVTRRFKAASDCLLYHAARHELNAIVQDERLDDLSNETLATLQSLDATSSRYLSIARQTEAACIGSDRDALAQVYTDALLQAALLGNPDAESCFVLSRASGLGTTAAGSWKSFEDRYLKYAPVFTRKALERGDPYVAARALYRYVASAGVHPSRLDDMPRADPYLTWRAARLASLRAVPEQRERLGRRLALLKEQNLLPPDAIRRADDWASTTYEREFAGQPPISLDSHSPCYSTPDLAP